LAKVILQEPRGEWFLTVAAGLEYMFSKPEHAHVVKNEEEDDEDGEGESDDRRNDLDDEEEEDARAREEAGADWMVEQGFDRKD
jgi:hypothetical protein